MSRQCRLLRENSRKANKSKWFSNRPPGRLLLLVKSQVLKHIGQELDKWTDLSLFRHGYFEREGRKAGYNLGVCADRVVHHFGTRVFAHTAPEG